MARDSNHEHQGHGQQPQRDQHALVAHTRHTLEQLGPRDHAGQQDDPARTRGHAREIDEPDFSIDFQFDLARVLTSLQCLVQSEVQRVLQLGQMRHFESLLPIAGYDARLHFGIVRDDQTAVGLEHGEMRGRRDAQLGHPRREVAQREIHSHDSATFGQPAGDGHTHLTRGEETVETGDELLRLRHRALEPLPVTGIVAGRVDAPAAE